MAKFGIVKTGAWKQAQKTLANVALRTQQAVTTIPKSEAEFFAGKMREGLDSQAPGGKRLKPISPATRLSRTARGISGDKALMSSKALYNGIKARRTGGKWFAGVSNQRRRGGSLAKLAAIHEKGLGPITVKMTPKMRAYLFGVIYKGRRRGSGSGSNVIIIRIPARPFIEPVFRRWGSQHVARMRVSARYAKTIGL